jgi:hypothetical protein
MVRSLRMQAVRATLLGLLAARAAGRRSRGRGVVAAGDQGRHVESRADGARSSQMLRWPRQVPLSRPSLRPSASSVRILGLSDRALRSELVAELLKEFVERDELLPGVVPAPRE